MPPAPDHLTHHQLHHRVPSGVLGGLGGSAGTMDSTEIAAGTALVVAATTGTVFAMRRRRSSRQH
ncbi:hypothetical protein NKH18_46790 [Streptomyces sp. M10(2022)]